MYLLFQGSNAVFAFHAIDPGGSFDISPHSGVLYVRDPMKLDREVQDTFSVIVSHPTVIASLPTF